MCPTASGGASGVAVTTLLEASRCVVIFPDEVERPAAGSVNYVAETFIYDAAGNMEVPDAVPTIEVRNVAGVVRVASTPMTLVSQGRYRYTHAIAAADALEIRVIIISVTEGGMTRTYGKVYEIVEEVAALAAILADTNAVDTRLPAAPADDATVAKEATLITKADALALATHDVNVRAATDRQTGADVDTATGALNIGAGEVTAFTITKSTRYKIHGCFLSIVNCAAGATITVRVYLVVNSVEVQIAEETYVAGTDPDGIIIVSSAMGATGNFRVSLQSDNAGDNAVVVPYQYVTEDME